MVKKFKLKHSKIFRRESGVRVRISVSLWAFGFGSDGQYQSEVHTCEKGKRLWRQSFNREDYLFRGMSSEDRKDFEYRSQLKLVTDNEIQEVLLELWNNLKPTN